MTLSKPKYCRLYLSDGHELRMPIAMYDTILNHIENHQFDFRYQGDLINLLNYTLLTKDSAHYQIDIDDRIVSIIFGLIIVSSAWIILTM